MKITSELDRHTSTGGHRKSAVIKGKNRVIVATEHEPTSAEQTKEEQGTNVPAQRTSDGKTYSKTNPVLQSTITPPEEYDMDFVLKIAQSTVKEADQNIPEQRLEIEPINSAEQNNKSTTKTPISNTSSSNEGVNPDQREQASTSALERLAEASAVDLPTETSEGPSQQAATAEGHALEQQQLETNAEPMEEERNTTPSLPTPTPSPQRDMVEHPTPKRPELGQSSTSAQLTLSTPPTLTPTLNISSSPLQIP